MKRLVFIIAMCICLGGCAHKIEMSNIGIVAGIGIDKTETGYLMSVQVVNPSSIAGNHQNTLPIITLEAEGSTLFEAYRRLSNLTSKVLYLPHLGIIVIDEDVAKDGINDILDFTLRNVQIRPNISLVVARGVNASDILSTLAPNETIPINQLNSLTNMCNECTGRQVNYNLYDALNMVNAKGINLVLNSVQIKGNDPELGEDVQNILETDSHAQFEVNHLAAFKQDKFVGYIDSHDAEYYNALLNNARRYIINTQIDEYYMTFEARETKVKYEVDVESKKVSVDYKVSGILMENQYPIDLSNPENVKQVQEFIKESVKQNVENVIKKTQEELKSDIIGVGSKIYLKDPKQWKKLEGYWDEIYPTLSFDINVEVDVLSVGDIQNLQKQ